MLKNLYINSTFIAVVIRTGSYEAEILLTGNTNVLMVSFKIDTGVLEF